MNFYRRLVFLIVLLTILAFPYSSHAKIVLGNAEMQTIHVNTVKGFLHFSLLNYSKVKADKWGPRYARSAQWLQVLHEAERTYDLAEAEGPEAALILAAMEVISRVVHGEIPHLPPDESLRGWAKVGARLKVEYSKKDGKTRWKYELPKKSKKKKKKKSKKKKKKKSKKFKF